MILKDSMFTVTGGTLDKVAVRLNASHTIYQAHFPGNPITPGVCIVQMISELLQNRLGRQLQLSRIANLKFVSVISPVTTPDVSIKFASVQSNDQECRTKGTIEAQGKILTKFSIIFNT